MVASNIGSLSDTVYQSIQPMPSNLSGLIYGVVSDKLIYVSTYTGDSIDGSNIPDKYQPAIEHLSLGHILKLMAVQEGGIKSASVGGTSASNDNLYIIGKDMELDAMEKLKALVKGIKVYKSRG